MLTCTGSLLSPTGKPIPGSHVTSELAPVWFADTEDTLHYSAVEWISSPEGSFKMRLLGILDYTADPNVTYLIGTVETGRWRDRDLTGASITVLAKRAFASNISFS